MSVSCKIYLLLCLISQIRFIDNTDPAGIDHQIAQLGPELATTLVIVISKVLKDPKFDWFVDLLPAVLLTYLWY